MPSLLARCVHGFSKTPAPAPIAPLIHEQTQSALCQLPADILEAITDALTPVERICLALTCKGLMGICMPKDLEKVKKHPSQTFQLLMNLEVLGGDQYPCYSCSKFHKRKSGRGPLERLATIGKRSFPKDGGLIEMLPLPSPQQPVPVCVEAQILSRAHGVADAPCFTYLCGATRPQRRSDDLNDTHEDHRRSSVSAPEVLRTRQSDKRYSQTVGVLHWAWVPSPRGDRSATDGLRHEPRPSE